MCLRRLRLAAEASRRQGGVGTGVLVAVAGGLHALSLAPQPRGWLQMLSVALWVAALSTLAPTQARRAAVLGAVFGTVSLVGTFWWLYISMHDYGLMPAPLAGGAVVLLALALSSFMAAASAAWVRWRPQGMWAASLLWAALLLMAELARGQFFTGFPWGSGGYAHVDSLGAVLAPWVGVYGIGAVAAAMAAALVLVPSAPTAEGRERVRLRGYGVPGWRGWVLPLGLMVYALWPAMQGRSFTQPGHTLAVTLLQGNVPQDLKFDMERVPADLHWHFDRLTQSQADVVITPETAIPLLPDQLPPRFWGLLQEHFQRSDSAALIGAPLGDFEHGYTNSVVGLQRGGADYRYDKHHLVPFGEFIPFGFRWFVDLMRMPLGDFARGRLAAPSFEVKGERVAPNICYEDVFGEELAARFADPALAPTVLANLTNIGWFGNTVAVDQHLQISRMRALELQRPMLRATNTGATAIIDHLGVVRQRLPAFTRGVLDGQVQARTGLTPYVSWTSRWGLWPLWGLAVAVVLGVTGLARRR